MGTPLATGSKEPAAKGERRRTWRHLVCSVTRFQWQGCPHDHRKNMVALLCMDKIHFAPAKNPLEAIRLVGICRGIETFQGFVGGAGFRPSTESPYEKCRCPRLAN